MAVVSGKAQDLHGNTTVSDRPLTCLASQALELPLGQSPLLFPFSNDAFAGSYKEAATLDVGVQNRVRSRVALVIGEGSLAAALLYIPERTVVVADINSSHVAHMTRYVQALRERASRQDWLKNMRGSSSGGPLFDTMLQAQIEEWEAAELSHPLADDEAYVTAHRLAQEKVFVPLWASVSNDDEMSQLGRVLRGSHGVITRAALSNVLSANHDLDHPRPKAILKALGKLPWASDAPILTSRFDPRDSASIMRDPYPIARGLDELKAGQAVADANAKYQRGQQALSPAQKIVRALKRAM